MGSGRRLLGKYFRVAFFGQVIDEINGLKMKCVSSYGLSSFELYSENNYKLSKHHVCGKYMLKTNVQNPWLN